MAIGTKSNEDNLGFWITLLAFGVLFGSASGAPSQKHPEPWWIDACKSYKDYHRSTTTQFPARHSRSAQETQLKTFSQKTDMFINELKSIYPKAPNYRRSLKWLPIKKMQKELNSSTHGTFYQAFHTTLQKFAIYMDHLRHIKIKTHIKFDEPKRYQIYDNATDQLKLVLCEFEDFLFKRKLQPKYLKSLKDISGHRSLPKSVNLTQLQIIDVQFFRKMGMFLRRSRRDLKLALRKDRKRRKSAKAHKKH